MDLLTRAADLKRQQPRLRSRDLADRLEVSEAELLAASCGDGNVTRLRGPWADLLARLEAVGTIMALTRNDAAVHERVGHYAPLTTHGPMGVVLGEEIDLRLLFRSWSSGYATTLQTARGPLPSLQFFDLQGRAVHKIYHREPEKGELWEALIRDFAHDDQRPGQTVEAKEEASATPEVDSEAFLAGWRGLKDTHEFFTLLRKHAVGRGRALRLAEGEFTTALPSDSPKSLLEGASADEVPIMVFVSSPGCIQIHSGPVSRIVEAKGWLNVLDERFNLHVKMEEIATVWRVHKPTDDGIVTSVELLDANDELRVQFFGVRKPGQAEDPRWRALVDSITP